MVRCPKCGSKRVSKYESKWKCDMCRCVFTSSNSDFDDFDLNDTFAQVEQLRRERREKEKLERQRVERERKEKEREKIRNERLIKEKREKTAKERAKTLNKKRIKEKAKHRHNYSITAHRKVIEAIKVGKTRAEAAQIANVSIDDINWWYNHGKQGEKPYDSYYTDYINAREIVKGQRKTRNQESTKIDEDANRWLIEQQLEMDRLEAERLKYSYSMAEKYNNNLGHKDSKTVDSARKRKIELKKKKLEKKRLKKELRENNKAKLMAERRNQDETERFKRLENEKIERREKQRLKRLEIERKQKEKEERLAKEKRKREKELAKEKRKKEEQEKKGIYVYRSLNLLEETDEDILRIVFDNCNMINGSISSKSRDMAMNYPLEDILRMIDEAKKQRFESPEYIEQQEKERQKRKLEKERQDKELEPKKNRSKYRVREGESYLQYLDRINQKQNLETEEVKEEKIVRTHEQTNEDIWAITIFFGILLLIYLFFKAFG